jgi:uncharacterized protein involved in exopolysaccharide biosynthesis
MAWLAGAASAWLPKRYEARMKILIKRERPNFVVGPESTNAVVNGEVTEQDVNAEVELLKSAELMKDVVRRIGITTFNGGRPGSRAESPAQVETAVRVLANNLTITPLRKTSIIQVAYSSSDAATSAAVLRNVAELYLQNHLRIHRAPGTYEFFKTQAERYQGQLSEAQTRFDQFKRRNSVVLLPEQKDLLVRRVMETEQAASEVSAAIAETQNRVDALKREIDSLESRVLTQSRVVPSQYSVDRLQTVLVELQNRRTDLTSRFQKDDRLVRDIEKQIADTSAALERARSMTSVEQTTDVNPVRQTLEGERSGAELKLAGLQARKAALATDLQNSRALLSRLDSATSEHDALRREITQVEDHGLLYAKKREEARISDSLDEQKFANASIIEQPTTPSLPSRSNPSVYAAAGCVLAMFLSVGLAFILNIARSTFSTAEELQTFSGVPVMAAVPVVDFMMHGVD